MPRFLAIAFHDELEDEETKHLDFIGRVDARGFAVGPFWSSGGFNEASPLNNGFLYGPLDSKGQVTGKDVVFVYPDMKTALYGEFRGNVLVEARATKVVGERCQNGLKRILVQEPRPDAPTYGPLSVGNAVRVSGNQPTLTDPYESRTVFIGDVDGVGEGLFAKRFIPNGRTFAYYGGLIFNVSEQAVYTDNMTKRDYERVHKNVITLTDDLWMNLPFEWWTLDKYRASLAHKVNHSFKKANCQFNTAFNPRFGVVRGVEATRDIQKGEQIFVEYGYPIEDLYPPWYVDLYLQEVGKLPPEAATTMASKRSKSDENEQVAVNQNVLLQRRKFQRQIQK